MIHRLLVLVPFLALSLYAQDIIYTAQMNNGRSWIELSEPQKIFYVNGLHDAWVQAAFDSPNVNKFMSEKWAEHFVVGDYVRELDALYKDGENVRIPIPAAMDYCTLKLKGQTTKSELEKQLMFIRKSWASASSKLPG